MIIRTWRGRAAPAEPDAYPQHFRFTVLPALKEIKGFLGASLLRHDRPDEIEFLVMTRWESLEAVRAFAGDHVDEGETIVEARTDKVNAEIPSTVTGTVAELLVKEGEQVTAGQAIARVTPEPA